MNRVVLFLVKVVNLIKSKHQVVIQVTHTSAAETDHLIAGLISRFIKVRAQSEKICSPLEVEDFVVQPIIDVSPPKWHLGHTTWFFEKMILEAYLDNYKCYNESYNYVFNSYYETVGKRVLRTNRGNLTRPSVQDIYKYRSFINDRVLDFLNDTKTISDHVLHVMELGLQHEQQHQELLLYDIKYILGTNPLFPVYLPKKQSMSSHDGVPPLEYLAVGSGNYRIGYEGNQFSFDNEHGVHQVYLHDYQIGNRLVTNQEYLEFIEDGGYQDFRFWYSEAWDWIKQNDKTAPFHWHKINGTWHLYTLSSLQEVDPKEPVSHVSQFEASAYACWKGMRLPTEFEWEVACKMYQHAIPESSNFVEKEIFKPTSPATDNFQFYGDLWEWTNSAYLPYPYFKTAAGALGEYNGKFMINQMVLRGGSYATPKDHIRATYRNFFHPNLNWHFTGIRLANHD